MSTVELVSMTFTKLFSSITESTIWVEDDQTRLVWITMLAMADRKGRVWASVPGLANRARVPDESVRSALQKFLSPDPDSRTKDYEGRRIEEIDGGWRLLNHEKYREIRDDEAVRESKRRYINKRRKAERVENVERSRPPSNQAEADADTDKQVQPALGLETRSTIPGSTVLPAVLASEPRFIAAWKMWLEHLKQKRKPPTLHAQDLQLRKCSELGLEEALKWIANAIEHNWQGLYEPTSTTRQPNNTQRVDRNAGTTNAGRAALYANVGKKVQLPNAQ